MGRPHWGHFLCKILHFELIRYSHKIIVLAYNGNGNYTNQMLICLSFFPYNFDLEIKETFLHPSFLQSFIFYSFVSSFRCRFVLMLAQLKASLSKDPPLGRRARACVCVCVCVCVSPSGCALCWCEPAGHHDSLYMLPLSAAQLECLTSPPT